MAILDDTLRFGGFVMAHAAWIASDLEDGDLICPFVVITSGDERKVVPFEAETQAEAISDGKASFEEYKESVDSWALGRDGLFSIVGSDLAKKDALFVSAWVKGLDEPIFLRQLYIPKSTGTFKLIGPIDIAIHGVIAPEKVHGGLRAVAMSGIVTHPHGRLWATWSATV
jgi:hypothetical protein